MKILILGATGYLGRHLIQRLSSTYSVSGLARRPCSINGVRIINLNSPDWQDSVYSIKPELIINTITCYGRNNESASEIVDANVIQPVRVIDAILKNYSEISFINCGTTLPKDVNLYSLTKCQLDEILCSYSSEKKFNYMNLNLESFYGIGCNHSFINFIFRQCIHRKELKLTHGEQYRDFIYIEDLVDAISLIIKKIDLLKGNRKIDIGSGHPIRIKQLVDKICEITHYTQAPLYGFLKYRENEFMHSHSDISTLVKLGWNPQFDIDKGLADLYSKEFK